MRLRPLAATAWTWGLTLVMLGSAQATAQVARVPRPLPRPSESPRPDPKPEPSPARSEPKATEPPSSASPSPVSAKSTSTMPRVSRSESQWRARLSPQQYTVTRRKGTEQAFTGQYWNHHGNGVYVCVCCETPLFDSQTKFESGTGWPSYWQPIDRALIKNKSDLSTGSIRIEVLCRVCDAHLGHVFNDGPRPTGLRYCINSLSLRFVERDKFLTHLEKWRETYGIPDRTEDQLSADTPASATSPAIDRPRE